MYDWSKIVDSPVFSVYIYKKDIAAQKHYIFQLCYVKSSISFHHSKKLGRKKTLLYPFATKFAQSFHKRRTNDLIYVRFACVRIITPLS